MECLERQSTQINKDSQKKGKQNYICVECGRQFIDCYSSPRIGCDTSISKSGLTQRHYV